MTAVGAELFVRYYAKRLKLPVVGSQASHCRGGFQRLRIFPAMAPSGVHWRGLIAPASMFSTDHGAKVTNESAEDIARYSSGAGQEYFGWKDAAGADVGALATGFLNGFRGSRLRAGARIHITWLGTRKCCVGLAPTTFPSCTQTGLCLRIASRLSAVPT